MPDERADERLVRPLRASMLLSEYGALLTPRQREALRLHYDEDWSLSEIAGRFGTTRQGIGDLMTRGERKLETLEGALHALRERAAREKALDTARAALAELPPSPAKDALSRLIESLSRGGE